jgi:hypothetical protein
MRRLKLTKELQERFLEALADTGSVSTAVAVAGTSRTRVYELRRADPTFASAWQEAEDIAADRLEDEARRRALEGVPEGPKVRIQTARKILRRRTPGELVELPAQQRFSPLLPISN